MKNFIKKIMPGFISDLYYYLLVLVGAFIYGFPSREMIVVGVTGTNGKSTVVEMIARILEEAGYKTASLSSIKFKIGEKEWLNMLKMTMPGRFAIQKFLSQAVKAGCKYAVLEITSEGIKQFRHKFIKFDGAVFTNLSPEHIESHRGYDNYRKAKEKLFEVAKGIHIINVDDKNAEHFLKYRAENKYGYGIKSYESKIKEVKIVKAEDVKTTESGVSFIVHGSLFIIPLMGGFNAYNALAAVCVGLWRGISLEICKKALEKITAVPGRMEIVARDPFMVVVDYAHTPAALLNVYKTLSNLKSQISNLKNTNRNSKLICVIGCCGGGRDKWKRPVLGKLAAQYCDETIITNEDPYDENPTEIIEQVANGAENISINQSNPYKSVIYKILDRKEAIKKALELAKPGDSVIITGKGCEPWICVANDKKIPWDDRQIVRDELAKK